MSCKLKKYKKDKITHWVGNDGTEYPYEDFMTWGNGIKRKGKDDLPLGNYPYTLKYVSEPVFLCCRICDCN